MPFDIPVLFLLFNRPQHASQVFESIRAAKPTQLYVAVDGPRPGRADDRDNVAQCLALLEHIDWPCELHTLIRPENLGCGTAVSSAITWFFDQVEMGIILEDDCLPGPSFFSYCREMLLRYRNDTVVMHIGGVNYQNGIRRGTGSYYFTKICHIWGWATWRRAWAKYDFGLSTFSALKNGDTLDQILTIPEVHQYWLRAFQGIHDRAVDTWDYQWVYAVWTNSGLAVLPNVNLVRNIGFDEFATHTKATDLKRFEQPSVTLDPIIHPAFIVEDKAATEYSMTMLFRQKKHWQKRVDRVKMRLQQRTWNL